MSYVAVINEGSGSLTEDIANQLAQSLKREFAASGRPLQIVSAKGGSLAETIRSIAEDSSVSTIVAAGGDGTISCAASHCFKFEKTLGILPTGTMNLIAKSISMPLDLSEAPRVLAKAQPTKIDIATANDRPFLHQYSLGLQPELVRRRDEYDYETRIGKMLSGAGATLETLQNLPLMRLSADLDGIKKEFETSMFAVSTNPHAEGHLPYPDGLTKGLSGCYWFEAGSAAEHAKLVTDLMLGNWSTNPKLNFQTAMHATVLIDFVDTIENQATVDGELIDAERSIEFRCIPRGLSVLSPTVAD